jgi:diguanylate cyclase (GGDEF)-like protein
MSQFRTRGILAVPMVFQGATVGVIELVSAEGAPPFTLAQLELLAPFADLAAAALTNARAHARVRELTIKDDCTGLFNARHLEQALELEVRRTNRYGRPVSLIFFDMDHFKQVNDTHGHQVGTRLLQEVGEMLLGSLRDVDVPVRYGGDEFVVLLPETYLEGARIVALRLWQQIRGRSFLAEEGLDLHLTASVGFAALPDQAQDARGLLRAADMAMYAAKDGGRDAVAMAGKGVITTQPTPVLARIAAG